jgi:hypothetical protein
MCWQQLLTLAQDCFVPVELTITGLKLGFEPHTEVDQVNHLPRIQLPAALYFTRVRDTDDQMTGVI